MAPGSRYALVDMLLSTGLASFKRAAYELITSGAVELNGERVKDPIRLYLVTRPSTAVT